MKSNSKNQTIRPKKGKGEGVCFVVSRASEVLKFLID